MSKLEQYLLELKASLPSEAQRELIQDAIKQINWLKTESEEAYSKGWQDGWREGLLTDNQEAD